jgi:hypothetical protein
MYSLTDVPFLELISAAVVSLVELSRGQVRKNEVAGQGMEDPTPFTSPVYPHLASTTLLASYRADGWKSISSRRVRLPNIQWLRSTQDLPD